MAINFISSNNSNEARTLHTKSDNIEIMIGNEADDITYEKFLVSFCKDIKMV